MKKNNKGFILANSIIVLTVLVVLGVALISIILANSASINKDIESAQASSVGEAGIERAIWQLNQSGSSYTGELNNQTVGGGSFDVTVQDISSDSKTITVTSYSPNKTNPISTRVLKVRVERSNSEDGSAFHYGVQVGNMGLTMSNNSKVFGNVYSGGNISGGNGSSITGDAYASGVHTISGLSVGNNAKAQVLNNLTITHDAYYMTKTSCTVGGTSHPNSQPPADIAMPLDDATITSWEQAAEAGGVFNGNKTISGSSATLGPLKINGDLNITNNSTLTMTGVIWVSGNINLSNNSIIKLDASYGDKSGMIIADKLSDRANSGKITPSNNSDMRGSGNSKSYMLAISMSTANPAISVANNATSVVYYAQNGTIDISNNAHLKAAAGRGLSLSNNAQVTYDSGLVSAEFVTGPGGVWVITSKSWEKF